MTLVDSHIGYGTKAAEEILQSVLVNVQRQSPHENFIPEMLWTRSLAFFFLFNDGGLWRCTGFLSWKLIKASHFFGEICMWRGKYQSAYTIPSPHLSIPMYTRRCHAPGLRPLHVHNLVIDLVWLVLQYQIHRLVALEHDEGEAAGIPRVPIPHDLHGLDLAVLFEVIPQRFLGRLPA